MGSLLYMAHFLMCRKLVSGTCRKLASYKSAGKFPTKHNRGLSSGCFCCLQSTFNVYVCRLCHVYAVYVKLGSYELLLCRSLYVHSNRCIAFQIHGHSCVCCLFQSPLSVGAEIHAYMHKCMKVLCEVSQCYF